MCNEMQSWDGMLSTMMSCPAPDVGRTSASVVLSCQKRLLHFVVFFFWFPGGLEFEIFARVFLVWRWSETIERVSITRGVDLNLNRFKGPQVFSLRHLNPSRHRKSAEYGRRPRLAPSPPPPPYFRPRYNVQLHSCINNRLKYIFPFLYKEIINEYGKWL